MLPPFQTEILVPDHFDVISWIYISYKPILKQKGSQSLGDTQTLFAAVNVLIKLTSIQIPKLNLILFQAKSTPGKGRGRPKKTEKKAESAEEEENDDDEN